jgi:predicted house-cleaning NTP pyrophosphatase (Maf/HAM1 superfamily)
VHTGVALVLPQAALPDGCQAAGPFCATFSETTNVVFDSLSPELIDAYIHTGGSVRVFGNMGGAGGLACLHSIS